jgi:RNA polymerase sigma-70 factor (ECF subfamily)
MDTADLVQETMLHTFRRLDAFEVRRRSALRAYLQQGIQNRIRDELRRVARGPAVELDENITDSAPSPLDSAITAEAGERYKSALSRLPPQERELIVGRFELEYSFDQLALVTGRRSADAARVALSRALVRLAAEMDRA